MRVVAPINWKTKELQAIERGELAPGGHVRIIGSESGFPTLFCEILAELDSIPHGDHLPRRGGLPAVSDSSLWGCGSGQLPLPA